MAGTNTATKTSPQNVKNLGNVEFVVEAARTVPDGTHTGSIVAREIVERGEEGFRYCDVHVAVDGTENKEGEAVVIKVGYAASKLSPETGLGQTLARFGAPIAEGNKTRPLEVFAVGRKVAFETVTERNKNGRFARIQPESLRPQ